MKEHRQDWFCGVLVFVLWVLVCPVVRAQSKSAAPVYKITPVASKIDFGVKASISIEGTFDKWDATLVFKSADVSTGVLDVKIQAASVNTGSGMKDDELRSDKFFNAKGDPYITFHSKELSQYEVCQSPRR